MVKIWKCTPNEVFAFLEAVQALSPCTIQQIQAKLRWHWSVIGNTKTFCEEVRLVKTQKEIVSLTEFADRLLRFTGQKRKVFVNNSPITRHPTFVSIVEEISKKSEIETDKIGDILKVKFEPKEKWEKQDFQKINESYTEWLVYTGQSERKERTLVYSGGSVVISGIENLKDFEFLKERELRHMLIQKEKLSGELIKELRTKIEAIDKETDDGRRGALFQECVRDAFSLLGFVGRDTNSNYEKSLSIFTSNTGGGDVALFFHFPIHHKTGLFEGGVLACEAKSTKGNVGGNSVGQARNFSKKILERFEKYFVQPIVVSRSTTGLDPSGKHLASPEVVHISEAALFSLLEIQKRKLNSEGSLITPSDLFKFLEELISKEKLEPSIEDIKSFFDN